MNEKVTRLQSFRHGQPGYYSLAELPQRPSIEALTLDSGWWEFDQIFRFYPGQFTVCTGIAGHGKSTFILNLLSNLALRHGLRSFLFVPENEQHLREKLRRIQGGTDGAFADFAKNYFFVQSAVLDRHDAQPCTLGWVLDQAVAAIEKDSVDVLLIDPWNELEHLRRKDQLMTDYIAESLMMLKAFSRAYSVAVVLIAHPTKGVFEKGKARTPGLADIEGSMNWYNKCDNGLIVERSPEGNTAKVISAKVRERGAGKRGVCHFYVDPETERFTPQVGAVT